MSVIRKTIQGVAWSAIGKAYAQLLNFITTIILARLLTPDAFGVLGMVLVVSNFVSLFGEFGFGSALVQSKDISEEDLTSVFWLNLGVGLVLGVAVAASAPLFGAFYGEPRVEPLLMVIAIRFLITPLNTVQRAIFTREMDFQKLAYVDAFKFTFAGAIAITMAATGWGVWALVAETLLTTTFGAAALWVATEWRPSFEFHADSIAELFGFSSNLLGFRVINYWARQIDDMLIGRNFGSDPLGNYTHAYKVMMMPLKQITGVLTNVMFPALSKIQDDPERVREIYLSSVGGIALVTFPLLSFLFAETESFILTLYGSHWLGAVPFLKIFCLVGIYQSVGTTVGWIYKSTGRTDWMFRYGLVASLCIIGAISFGIWWGSAYAVAVSYAVMTGGVLLYPQFTIPGKLIDMTFLDVVRAVSAPFASSAVMVAVVMGVGSLLPAELAPALRFIGLAVIGIGTYVAIVHVAGVQAYVKLRGIVADYLDGKFNEEEDEEEAT